MYLSGGQLNIQEFKINKYNKMNKLIAVLLLTFVVGALSKSLGEREVTCKTNKNYFLWSHFLFWLGFCVVDKEFIQISNVFL